MKSYILSALLLQKLIWIPTRLALRLFGHLHVRGLEHLKGIEGPVIFASNHTSEIDALMVPGSLPFFSRFSPLFYVVREKSFYDTNGWRRHIFNTWFINAWGGYGAAVGLRDYEKALARHIEILRDGGSFCIYPEGSITKDGNIQPGKGGISYLAHSAPCTIIPAAVSGVYGMSPPDFFLGRRNITVRFGEPIKPEKLFGYVSSELTPGESVWKAEADYIMKKVGELLVK